MSDIFDLDLNGIDSIIEKNLSGTTVKETSTDEPEDKPIYRGIPGIDDDVTRTIQANIEAVNKLKKNKPEDGEEEEVKVDPQTLIKDNKDTEESPLVPYAAVLKEMGVLPEINVEEFNKATKEQQVEMLKEAEEESINNRAEGMLKAYVDTMPDKLKLAFQSWADGVELDIAVNAANDIDKYKKIDPTMFEKDHTLARNILKRDFLNSGYSEEDAEELANEPIDPKNQATKALNRVIKFEEDRIENEKKKLVQQEENAKKAQEEVRNNLKKHVESVKEVIPGVTIPNKLRDKIWENMTVPVKDKNGNLVNRMVAARNENPVEFETKLHYLFEVTKGFKDFTVLVNNAKTEAVKRLEQQLDRESYNSAMGGRPHQFDNGKDTDVMAQIRKVFGS